MRRCRAALLCTGCGRTIFWISGRGSSGTVSELSERDAGTRSAGDLELRVPAARGDDRDARRRAAARGDPGAKWGAACADPADADAVLGRCAHDACLQLAPGADALRL